MELVGDTQTRFAEFKKTVLEELGLVLADPTYSLDFTLGRVRMQTVFLHNAAFDPETDRSLQRRDATEAGAWIRTLTEHSAPLGDPENLLYLSFGYGAVCGALNATVKASRALEAVIYSGATFANGGNDIHFMVRCEHADNTAFAMVKFSFTNPQLH